jgi:thiosulfate dehydrogenase [quinone] large subunit
MYDPLWRRADRAARQGHEATVARAPLGFFGVIVRKTTPRHQVPQRPASARRAPERRGPKPPTGILSFWRFSAPPPRALALAGWALLPLRAFLGVTFTFAGLQKLANPDFFNAASPSGIHAQLVASEHFSPLGGLLGHLVGVATPIGILIALSEIAVGVGTLLGLLAPVAAVGGLLLSLTLFLTVSWNASPYYTGADIVFFFAWIPLLLAGTGRVLSLDDLIQARTRREAGQGPATLVPVRFEVIQGVCGHFDKERCTARGGAPCQVSGCPFLAGDVGPRVAAAARGADPERRRLVLTGLAAGAVGAVALGLAGLAAGLGRAIGGTSSAGGGLSTLPAGGTTTTVPPATTTAPQTPAAPSTTTTTVPPPAGKVIGTASEVPVGAAARFSDPASGDPAIVLQPSPGTFTAFDAICPHAGCTVGYARAARLIACPCHGSVFNPVTGAVLQGPAPHGLRQIPVVAGSDGKLYVQD